MLISSPRHTAADLALWAEYEAADREHFRLARVGAKAARAADELRKFAAAGPFYGSVSWGKDSVVLAHLIVAACPGAPLVHVRAVPADNPHCADVRDAFLASFPCAYRESAADYSGAPAGPPDGAERFKDRVFFGAFLAHGPRHASGVRADESAARKLRFRRWGLTSPNACAPLGRWSAADVFAYLAHHGLPAHPSYAMLGGGRWERKHLRVDELGGARGDQFGRAEWEREYYGEHMRRLGLA